MKAGKCQADHGCVASIHKAERKRKKDRPAEQHQDMEPAPMQCKMTRSASQAENVDKKWRDDEKDKKEMKKEKRRNMSSAKAGAHDAFVVLSMGEGGVVWGKEPKRAKVGKPRQGQDHSFIHSFIHSKVSYLKLGKVVTDVG